MSSYTPNFLDLDLNASYSTSYQQNAQTSISNNTLFNSNPNLTFNASENAPSLEYSYSLDHLMHKDDLSFNFMLDPSLTETRIKAAPVYSKPQAEFHIEEFNMPTPTDSSVDSILLEQQQQQNLAQNLFNLPTSSPNMSFFSSQSPQGIISRSNSQPDLANTINLTYYNYYYHSNSSSMPNSNYINQGVHQTPKLRRYPSLTYKTSMSECAVEPEFTNFNDYLLNTSLNNANNISYQNSNPIYSTNGYLNPCSSYSTTTSGVSSSSSLTTTSGCGQDQDGLFLGIDAITDFLNKNSHTCSDLFEDLPDLEDLMSLVTFETSSSASAPPATMRQSTTQQPLTLSNLIEDQQTATNNPNTNSNSLASSFLTCMNPMSNFYDYGDMESFMIEQNLNTNCLNSNLNDGTLMNSERTTRSAPPSPTTLRKKQRPTANLPWHKPWNKMDDDEKSKTVVCLTRIINDEMGLREQLEIIRILNPDTKLKPTDTQFVIDLKMIDDEKFKRIKDVIKTYGLSLNDKSLLDTSASTDCPLAKRELRIKRAQQRLKLKQKKEQRQMVKENKSGLFCKTEVVPLKRVLPEEDIDIDILS